MKKFTLILGIAALGLVACKKEIKADTVQESATTDSLNAAAMAQNPASAPVSSETTPVAAPAADSPEMLKEAASKGPMTNLVISENTFDFKDVKKGNVVEHKFEFTNTGKNPLIISSVKPACGCTVPDYSKDPILPGKKGFVNLKFDSSSFDGLQNKSAEVYANVENMPIKLSFSANVVK